MKKYFLEFLSAVSSIPYPLIISIIFSAGISQKKKFIHIIWN